MGNKLSSLQKIRQQIASQNTGHAEAIKPLNPELLQEAWDKYIVLLKERKNHSAVTNFKLAQLRILSELNFDIVTGINIQQKFIDQERSSLIEHIQTFFNNRLVTYQVVLEESTLSEIPLERPLNTKELFQQMTDQYPLVRELKERLKLDLDY
jgi:DNA polymerase-3 subunit gamma/tau